MGICRHTGTYDGSCGDPYTVFQGNGPGIEIEVFAFIIVVASQKHGLLRNTYVRTYYHMIQIVDVTIGQPGMVTQTQLPGIPDINGRFDAYIFTDPGTK